MLRWLGLAILSLIALRAPIAAQDGPRQVLIPEAAAPDLLASAGAFSSDYQVGPGDQLEIQVIGNEELRSTVRVSNSGEVNLPMLGPILILDMTTFEIEDDIARRLRETALILKPEVLVSVQQFQAKPVYVMGAVTTPGEFIMSQSMTVVDGILMVGGLRANAADEAFLYRRPAGSSLSPALLAVSPGIARPGVEVVKFNLKPLKEGRFNEAATAIDLRRGDVIVVPTMTVDQFFVVGDVVEPRNYMYAPGKQLLASQAISWAGGPLPTAKLSEGMLVRYDEQGTRIEIKMDWGAIIRGKQQDFPIQPNDIIFVPGSTFKSITYGLLMLTGSMMQSTAFRVGRSYQMPDAPSLPTRPVSPPPQ